ncbi:decarboxylating 6-phosphogluconate dehydrogenase [Terribacillus saccharophilus]|uniref:phosphogluconate dehydrogenase (NAD(+)-dependent, decarboxylating) n=1 Tax=Terribacillus saccharophilus TaxID=361277 RepID=UPI003982274C
MHIGLIGLGKMGFNLGLNLLDNNFDVTAFDVSEDARDRFAETKGTAAASLKELVDQLPSPKIVWSMVPAGEITDKVLEELKGYLSAGDILMDGGNSNYKQSVERAKVFAVTGVHFFDVGTSGGTDGARNGVCTMIGGDAEVFKTIEPIFQAISVKDGYHYAGKSGSGHFLKMVHNGMEYGMMQAIAEGFEVLEKSDYDFDYEQVAKMWNNGSVIRSWLMELVESAFSKDPKLDAIRGVMHSSGEGKWTVETALELQAATPVIAMSLMMRYRSLDEDTFSGKVVAALRNEFGGHAVVKR